MHHADFKIGQEFYCAGVAWRCTDIGTRVVIAIKLDEVKTASNAGSDSTLNREQAEQAGWFKGPPYAVAEYVFDESDQPACAPMRQLQFTGNLLDDMEFAKRLIGDYPNVDLAALTAIAADQSEPTSARVAAIYTLGYTDDAGLSEAILARIADDVSEPAEIIDHAKEAMQAILAHESDQPE